jgi:hypothetical protein
MLRDAEEYGRQHVFLFSCSRNDASSLVNEGVLEKNLAKLDLSELLKKPRIVNRVAGLQLVEAVTSAEISPKSSRSPAVSGTPIVSPKLGPQQQPAQLLGSTSTPYCRA